MPCSAVVEMIEQKEGAAVIFNQPCDSFFSTLAKELGHYPPKVLSAPLDHIEDRLKTQLSDSCQKAIAETIQYIERARDAIKNGAATKTLQVQTNWMEVTRVVLINQHSVAELSLPRVQLSPPFSEINISAGRVPHTIKSGSSGDCATCIICRSSMGEGI